jgi:hypothetical protein
MFSDLYPFQLVANIPALNLTVLRTPVPIHMPPPSARPLDLILDHDFAILWDEDRDQRIIPAARSLYYRGLIPGWVCMLGERKGHLTLSVDPEHPAWRDDRSLPEGLPWYEAEVCKAVADWVDSWDVEVVPLAGEKLKIAQLLKLGSWIRDAERLADNKLPASPPTGWLAL